MQREINMNRIAIALLLASLLAGCGSTATPTPPPTPVELFQQLIAGLSPSFGPGLAVGGFCEEIVVKDVSYDVQTTTSLVTPYIGVATFQMDSAQEHGTAGYKYETTLSLTYAFQDGAWVYKDAAVEGILAKTCKLQ
jgi:hypothetical protein